MRVKLAGGGSVCSLAWGSKGDLSPVAMQIINLLKNATFPPVKVPKTHSGGRKSVTW